MGKNGKIATDLSDTEQKAFDIVKSVLKNHVDIERLTAVRNDSPDYFSIKLDEVEICRIGRHKKSDKLKDITSEYQFQEPISSPDDISIHASKLIETLRYKAAKIYLK